MIEGIIFSSIAMSFVYTVSAISRLIKKTKKIWIIMFVLSLLVCGLSYAAVSGYIKIFDLGFSILIQVFLVFAGAFFGYDSSQTRHFVLELTYGDTQDDVNPDEVL